MLDIKNLKITLDEELSKDRNVIIIPHLGIDFDAIGSAIGLSILATKYKRESFILVDDPIHKIDSGVKIIMDESRMNLGINYIDKNTYLKNTNPNELVILTDVNKYKLICLEEKDLKDKDTIIIDHHNEDNLTVKTDKRYIDQNVSSASEIITKLLSITKTKYTEDVANYLLAGIYLDTKHFSWNTSSETHKLISKLLEKGGSVNKVNDYFLEDIASDQRVLELVRNPEILSYSYATVVGKDANGYTKEELAKAADYLLKYRVDASFAIGKIDDNIVSISARSKGKINIGEIMKQLGGGGNLYSAATKIDNTTPEDGYKTLQKVIKPIFYNQGE